MNKSEFFAEMKACRVNETAYITYQPHQNGKTSLIMAQRGAPNAHLSMHRDCSPAMLKAMEKYELWLVEYFAQMEAEIEAIEQSEVTQSELVEVLMHEEADVVFHTETLAQKLADRRVWWLSKKTIANVQRSVIEDFKTNLFRSGLRSARWVLNVICKARLRSSQLKGYAEYPAPVNPEKSLIHELPF
jgi:hypothetical protein